MKTVIILTAILFYSNLVFSGPLLLISDIDDTVKVTNVQNPADAVSSLKRKESFVGMSTLYSQLLSQRLETKLFYLTGSPEVIRPIMMEFLLDSGLFLGAQLTMKASSGDIQNYKVSELRRILQNFDSSADTILIGDNTQKDPSAYEITAQEFSQVKARYIRRVKNNLVLPEGSKYFDSALDIALFEFQDGRLNENSLQILAQEIQQEKRARRLFIKTTVCPKVFAAEPLANSMSLSLLTTSLINDAYKQKRALCKERKLQDHHQGSSSSL